MKKRLFHFCWAVTLLLVIPASTVVHAVADEPLLRLTVSQIELIHESVQRSMADGKIPGVSLVIVSGNEVIYSKGFGYADVGNQVAVTMETVFELGSNSKAFTGLAMLKLESEGLVDLSAPVDNYLPWLAMSYSSESVMVTVEQVMNHTSGIPFSSIDRIPESTADDALEETVRTLVGTELQTRPGEAFSYATINYNILGLIIERVTGQSYESYMIENILQPIGLNNTYMFHEDAGVNMAIGYQINFLRAREFDAPIYRGNKPAGYILSSGHDIAKWMITQLGFNDDSAFDQRLIERSHAFGAPLQQGSHLSYNAGWFVSELTGDIFHSGSNPNFSSSVVLDTETGIGITVLANLNSQLTDEIISNVRDIIQGAEPGISEIADLNLEIDRVAVVIICVSTAITLLMMFLIARLLTQIRKKQRAFVVPHAKGIIGMCLLVTFLATLSFIVSQLPRIFFNGIGWQTAAVWAPGTLVLAVAFAGIAVLFISLCLVVDLLYRRKENISNKCKERK